VKKTIVVSLYLCDKGQEKKVAYFERLDAHLCQSNYKLFLVNVGPEYFKTSIDHITMPACITYASRIHGNRYMSEMIFPLH